MAEFSNRDRDRVAAKPVIFMIWPFKEMIYVRRLDRKAVPSHGRKSTTEKKLKILLPKHNRSGNRLPFSA